MVNKVKLQRWSKHLARAAARGVTLAQYAREHGLSKHTLYAARQQQSAQQAQGRGVKPVLQRKGKAPRSAFIAVRLPEIGGPEGRAIVVGAAMLQARLPNGVQIGIEVGGTQASTAPASQASTAQAPWAQVLQALAGLACSR